MQIVKTQKIEWQDVGSNTSEKCYFRAPVYNQDINNLIKEMYENDLMDLNYIENYKLIADKDIDTLQENEILTFLTYIIRGERFSEGLIAIFTENGTIEKLTTRYNQLKGN